MSLKYQTIDDLRSHLDAVHDKVINFQKYPEYKTLEYRDRCLANFGSTGNFNVNPVKGDFGGTIGNTYK